MERFKSKEHVNQVVNRYGDVLMKTCFACLGNRYDAEEVVQETFLAYMVSEKDFRDDEHRKAWLLRVAINKSKNLLRSRRRHSYVNLDDIKEVIAGEEKQEMLTEIMKLPHKIKTAVHLHYYEGYTCREIGAIVGATEATVKKRLQRGRELLRDILGGE
ncbi:MAG: RNA polymerase sigma factor [Lachnospiraceae bacterium]|nr:RNA polymerase sigma factor [Lachnospiraceae bacterium]